MYVVGGKQLNNIKRFYVNGKSCMREMAKRVIGLNINGV